MTRNPHRVNWIGRDGIRGRYCHARGCYVFAANLKAQQVHADVYEPGVRLPTEGVLLDDEDGRRVFDCPVCGSGGFGDCVCQPNVCACGHLRANHSRYGYHREAVGCQGEPCDMEEAK